MRGASKKAYGPEGTILGRDSWTTKQHGKGRQVRDRVMVQVYMTVVVTDWDLHPFIGRGREAGGRLTRNQRSTNLKRKGIGK
jgi:hypothetical protein